MQALNETTGQPFANYTFVKPVELKLWFNLEELAGAGGSDTDVEPALLVLDPSTGAWVDAASSCDPRVVTIQPDLRRITVRAWHVGVAMRGKLTLGVCDCA